FPGFPARHQRDPPAQPRRALQPLLPFLFAHGPEPFPTLSDDEGPGIRRVPKTACPVTGQRCRSIAPDRVRGDPLLQLLDLERFLRRFGLRHGLLDRLRLRLPVLLQPAHLPLLLALPRADPVRATPASAMPSPPSGSPCLYCAPHGTRKCRRSPELRRDSTPHSPGPPCDGQDPHL